MLTVLGENLFLAPQIKTAMVMQCDDARSRPVDILRNQDECGNPQIGSGLEGDVLERVAIPIRFADYLGCGLDRRRRFQQAFQNTGTCPPLPLSQRSELG